MDVIHGDLTEHKPISGTLTPVDDNVFNGELTTLGGHVVDGSLSMILPNYDYLHGDLTEHKPISGTLTPVDDDVFNGELTTLGGQVVGGSLSMILPNYYEGETVIIPKGHEGTILETTGKTMRSDVMVTEVPYFETSNEAGGTTVYIAREV